MRRALVVLALGCAREPDPGIAALALEVARLRSEVQTVGRQLEQAGAERDAMARQLQGLSGELGDARALALIGGPRRRYSVGVSCSAGPFLEGSLGEQAFRALHASGWCRPFVPVVWAGHENR